MRKFNYFCSMLLVVTLPLMIVILTSNLVLRTSETYNYHFNDSEAINNIPFNIEEGEMASKISSYFSSFSGDKFQVYEDNGIYKDPVFSKTEQNVMASGKKWINMELGIGLLLFALTLGIYVYLWKNGFKEALRKRYVVGAILSVILLIVQGVCWAKKSFRLWIYGKLIGIELGKDSTLITVLGDPFFKTYILFATIFAVAAIMLLTYVNYKLTKPERIFY